MALTNYRIEQTISIFKNDPDFERVVVDPDEGAGITLLDGQYRELAELLLENNETLSEYTIDELNSMVPSFLRDEIALIYNRPFITRAVYKQTLYTYKYSAVKIFFRENYDKFLPDFDVLNIQSNEKKRVYHEAFMREFDRLAFIIDEMYNVPDIDKVPNEYLNYLAQAVGYEREDNILLGDASFRELVKNIIEVYKIKGTNYSFELFFSFLGFETEITEFWFDQRFSDFAIASNPFTGATDKNLSSFYLSPTKPTQYIPDGMADPYIILEEDIVATQDLNQFDRWTQDSVYSYQQLLGINPGYPGQPYTFFKTNVMQYSLTSLEEISGDEDELSSEDLVIIQRYADFLTPIFIAKSIVIQVRPFEEQAEGLILSDDNRPDPRSSKYVNNDGIDFTFSRDETMFHLYQGYQPGGYYWEDGVRLYADPVPNNGDFRWSGLDIEPGGHFISGYYKDTYDLIYDPTNGSGSVYEQISNAFPLFDRERILEEISSLIKNRTIFTTYGVPSRDVIPPFIDEGIFYPFLTIGVSIDDFSVGTPLKMSAENIKQFPRLMPATKYRFSDRQEPKVRDFFNDVSILSITVDNGSGQGVITVDDNQRKFQFLNDLTSNPLVENVWGDFTAGSEWVENVEYTDEFAPIYNGGPGGDSYVVGDYVKYNSGSGFETFICTNDTPVPAPVTLDPVDWQRVFAINLVEEGQKIFDPDQLFGIEVMEVDRIGERFRLNRISYESYNEKKFELYTEAHLFLQITQARDRRNNGVYKVFSSSTDPTTKVTTITFTSRMAGTSQGIGGRVQIYAEPWLLKNFRYPFMFNEIEITSYPQYFVSASGGGEAEGEAYAEAQFSGPTWSTL